MMRPCHVAFTKERIMHTKINWFEIPSVNLSRATQFYETIFDAPLQREEMENFPMAIFSGKDGQAIGCVIHGEPYKPSEYGTVIYLDAGPSINDVIARIRTAGGQVVMEKTKLPGDIGYIAHFVDTEGNRMALHAAP